MPRPNWFFAFPVTGDFLRALPDPPAAFRAYHPDDVHLTLAFLGGCGQDGAERALEVLDRAFAEQTPTRISIALGEVVPMGSRRSYSVLAALLGQGRDEVTGCLCTLRDGLTEAASGRREKRPPKPHVTLVRARRRANDEDRARGLEWAEGLELGCVNATLDRVALYTWSEPRRERQFRIVTERPLR